MKQSRIPLYAILYLLFFPGSGRAIGNADTLAPFRVVVHSGDDVMEKSEIVVYRKQNKYYADNLAPFSYVGTRTDSVWTTELNNEKVQACIKFLNTARELPAECPEVSTIVKDYQVTAGSETYKVRGDCDWDGLDFFDLRNILFYEKIGELESRRLALIKTLNKQLLGTWYFAPLKTKPQKGDYYILQRTAAPGFTCSWEFGNSYAFKSHSCNDELNLTYSIRYLLNVDGNIYCEIQGGSTINKEGHETIRNYGATFIIESVNEQELKMKYLRR